MRIGQSFRSFVCVVVTAGVLAKGGNARGEEGNEHPWSVSLSAGRIDMEGDFPTEDGVLTSLLLGYDYSDWWTFEGGIFVAPGLKAQTIKGRQNPDGSFEYRKPLEENAGVSETTGYGATLDALFHFTPWKRVDPYLALGIMGIGFTDDFSDDEHSQFNGGLRGGAGLIYNLNDQWSVRADFRAALAEINGKGSVHSSLDAGIRYVLGANVPPSAPPPAASGPRDSDADGLVDAEEAKSGTNPHERDTDKDGLTDGDEVAIYKTDPLNPDTDFDGLKDGEEVLRARTNPLLRDTDKGGVADGHEAIEDKTNPLEKADDLEMYELHIEFAEGSAEIGAQYHEHLDVIGKILTDIPAATVRIEGHIDQVKDAAERQALRLTSSRAEAVREYLEGGRWKIKASRMTAKGYGFSRPKEKPDLERGNPANRRIEVYVRRPTIGAQ
jgi:outer membrane protein OmpA-like peptidoglycan-associated protein/opacity protein-like surface antigen